MSDSDNSKEAAAQKVVSNESPKMISSSTIWYLAKNAVRNDPQVPNIIDFPSMNDREVAITRDDDLNFLVIGFVRTRNAYGIEVKRFWLVVGSHHKDDMWHTKLSWLRDEPAD